MANCPQINNTTIIGTSAVTYDGTPLPCTGVNACDDLNTILTKFDNVICSVVDSVNIIREEVINITEDLMIIIDDVENIQNQLFICCPICEFTGTANELLVCDFVGTADEQLICTFAGETHQVPDPTTTTTSTSTSTSTSSTSTSTTTSTTTNPPTPEPVFRVRGGLGIVPCSDGFDAFVAVGSGGFVIGDIVQYVRLLDTSTIICGEIMATDTQVPDAYIFSLTPVDVCGNPTYCDIPNPG
jgi:hypothetical protein